MGDIGVELVRRSLSARYEPNSLRGTKKWGTKIMFWGAINVRGVSDIVFIDGTMDSKPAPHVS